MESYRFFAGSGVDERIIFDEFRTKIRLLATEVAEIKWKKVSFL